MTLKEKTWHAWLYKSTYNSYILPEDYCSYFWKMCSLVLLFPFCLIGHIINLIFYYKRPEDSVACLVSGVVTFLCFLFSGLIYDAKSHRHSNYWLCLLDVGIGIIVISAILVIICYIFYLIDEWRKKRKSKPMKPNLIVEFIKAKKNKYCPKIDWV